MSCTSACPTQDHQSWGECRRALGLAVTHCRSATNPRHDYSASKRWNRELDMYAAARKQGIQPDTTKRRDVEQAIKASDKTGIAYGRTG